MLALASVLSLAPLVTGIPQISSVATPHPVKSQRHEVAFASISVASMRVAKGATGSAETQVGAPDPITTARAGAMTPVQDVAGDVAVVGVTWPKNAVTAGDQFQIRTLTGASWSRWETLDADQQDGPDPAEGATATRGTSPYVVTGATKFEVRSLTTDATAPTAARVQVVDPGTSSADDVQAAPGAAQAAVAMPVIYTRAGWGADESMRRGGPSYGQVMLGFVHHTVSANSYAASEVPAMIRGIYAYHVQAQGWNDIGYNFLIDRFGRTWEGRYGGMDRAVVGAQTLNYNAVSTGVSAIGNFDVGAIPQAMTDAYKRLFAWKLSIHGVPASGTVLANGKSFQRISGHRDGFSTTCPGRYLYAKLGEIRAGAAAIIGAQPPAPPPPPPPPPLPPPPPPPPIIGSTIRRDVDRNGAADLLSYAKSSDGSSIGRVSVLASGARQPATGTTISLGWGGLRNIALSPDMNGDRRADLIAQDPVSTGLRIYLGNGKGGFSGVLKRGRGWNGMTRIIVARDRNRDGRNDILATTASGDLLYYPGDGAGWLSSGRLIGRGWNTIGSITTAGDLNHDGYLDLLATRNSDGMLMMYAGRRDGSLVAGVAWRSGWGQFSPVIGGSDLDGDAYPDVYTRFGDVMNTYSSDHTGRLVRTTRWGSGWRGYTQLSTGADWNGDGVADLLAVNPSVGALRLFAGVGQRELRALPTAFPTVAGADLVRIVGDVNADGYVDVVARIRTDASLKILLGRAGGTFAAPVKIGSGWNRLSFIEPAGDYDGDGVPDLLARDTNGSLFLYAFRRDLTFKPPRTIGVGWQGMASVVGVGQFDGDANGDVIALRASDHALILYRGGGSTALLGARVLKTGQSDLVQIMGVGDYNGNGTPDVLARSSAGPLWVYPGDGTGALADRQSLRGGQGAGHVLG